MTYLMALFTLVPIATVITAPSNAVRYLGENYDSGDDLVFQKEQVWNWHWVLC